MGRVRVRVRAVELRLHRLGGGRVCLVLGLRLIGLGLGPG